MRGVIVHEMGHHVVAKALGFQVLDLTIHREAHRLQRHAFHGAAHVALISPIHNDKDLETYLKARIMVLNAGSLAQAFDGTTVDAVRLRSIRSDNGIDDLGKANELFVLFLNRRIANGHDHEYAESNRWAEHYFWQECEEAANTIIRDNWTAIERVVADAGRVLQSCDFYGRTAEQLTHIGREEPVPVSSSKI